MRLTLMTDYALRLLLYLAQHPDRLSTIAEIAQAHRISEAHLMKVTHELARQAFIVTVRGKGGGMRLARTPAAINLGDVVRGIEPDFAVTECFTVQSRCALTGQCRLAGVLADALADFLAHLDAFTLADLVPGTRTASVPTMRRLVGPRATS